MNKYIKNFSDFINEKYEKNIADLKVDELLKNADETGRDYDDVMKEYLEENLNPEEFLNHFKDVLFENLKEAWSDMVEYEEPYTNEDGDPDGGSYINGELGSFDLDLQDDEVYGEFGISFGCECKNKKTEIYIFAFNGELDITKSELGQAMIETFNKLYDLSRDAAENDNDMSMQDAKDLENTYREISRSNGWSY